MKDWRHQAVDSVGGRVSGGDLFQHCPVASGHQAAEAVGWWGALEERWGSATEV